jgi:methionyl-tRNA formyltransferase
MSYGSVLVISDNEQISREFISILAEKPELCDSEFRFACHPKNTLLLGVKVGGYIFEAVDLKSQYQEVIQSHDLVISAHCKQIFPSPLVTKRKCINLHPGYNPYNRGWYPQVFSIINGLPSGATIHEIDEELDHGRIIDREKIETRPTDTSLSVYNRVLKLESMLLRRNLSNIINDTYVTFAPEEEGNVNLRGDFDALKEIKLDEVLTFESAINRLRALSHPPFKNAYFIDPLSGQRIWIETNLGTDK